MIKGEQRDNAQDIDMAKILYNLQPYLDIQASTLWSG